MPVPARVRAHACLRLFSLMIPCEISVQRFCTSLFSPNERFNTVLATAFLCSFISSSSRTASCQGWRVVIQKFGKQSHKSRSTRAHLPCLRAHASTRWLFFRKKQPTDISSNQFYSKTISTHMQLRVESKRAYLNRRRRDEICESERTIQHHR